MINITIFGSSKQNLDKSFYEQTEILITNIDKNKYSLVYGGGNLGLMGYVRKFSGKVISSNLYKFILNDLDYPKDDYLYENIEERQRKMMDLGDIYLVLPGGYGTHYEALEVITKNDIGETNKPIFIFNVNNVYDKLIDHINDLIKSGFITRDLDMLKVYVISDPIELSNIINNF
jgi:uncharacterized protein (TIGR00730 family)